MDGDQALRPPIKPLEPAALAIFHKMAGEYADSYIQNSIFAHVAKILNLPGATEETLLDALEDPRQGLLTFYAHYAFARRGKDKDDLSQYARTAFLRVTEGIEFEELLQAEDGVPLWEAFEDVCKSHKAKSNETQNRGLLQGMLELAQEIYRIDKVGSIISWVIDGIERTGRLEPQFLRVVDIRGVGPKITSTYMRDVIGLFDLESSVEAADKIYIQPVDRWLRQIAPFVVPEDNMEDAADWIVAGKINKYARRAAVSGVRFNMGTSYFGQRIVKVPDRFEAALRQLAFPLIPEDGAEQA